MIEAEVIGIREEAMKLLGIRIDKSGRFGMNTKKGYRWVKVAETKKKIEEKIKEIMAERAEREEKKLSRLYEEVNRIYEAFEKKANTLEKLFLHEKREVRYEKTLEIAKMIQDLYYKSSHYYLIADEVKSKLLKMDSKLLSITRKMPDIKYHSFFVINDLRDILRNFVYVPVAKIEECFEIKYGLFEKIAKAFKNLFTQTKKVFAYTYSSTTFPSTYPAYSYKTT